MCSIDPLQMLYVGIVEKFHKKCLTSEMNQAPYEIKIKFKTLQDKKYWTIYTLIQSMHQS